MTTAYSTSRVQAPEFPASFEWLNAKGPLSLGKQLKGQVVVLDFWTYCCINCMHVLPDLEYIEAKYADDPVVVIGVHSAKFDNEREAEQIGKAIARYRIGHPVIVDQEFGLWNLYGVRAWPTLVFIDTAGRIAGAVSGENKRDLIDSVVAELLKEGRENHTLADRPLRLSRLPTDPGQDRLYFPGKIAADPAAGRLAVADSSHNRVLVIDANGKVLYVVGDGKRGLTDGPLGDSRFANPQGLAIHGDEIYVADTDNHALRRIDLAQGRVTTLAGTGKQSYGRSGGRIGTEQGLNSPWGLALHEDKLYIAMAGPHQLWRHDLKTGATAAWAGSGAENIIDGPADQAALAQPSGIAVLDDKVYFADSEVSAVRSAGLANGRVRTLIGQGLFTFGYRDGRWAKALLQHPLGIVAAGDGLIVADTYNHCIRFIDRSAGTIETLYGGKGKLDEPGGVAVLNDRIYIADTNNHRIVRYDAKTGQAETLDVVADSPLP